MNTISGLGALGVTELDTSPQPEIVAPGETSVAVTVVDPEGAAISNATVIAKRATARLDGVELGRTNATGTAQLTLDPNQVEGTITLDVKPPDGSYVDRRENAAILVGRA